MYVVFKNMLKLCVVSRNNLLIMYKLFVVFSNVCKLYVVSRDIFHFRFHFTTLVVRMSAVALAE